MNFSDYKALSPLHVERYLIQCREFVQFARNVSPSKISGSIIMIQYDAAKEQCLIFYLQHELHILGNAVLVLYS